MSSSITLQNSEKERVSFTLNPQLLFIWESHLVKSDRRAPEG